MFRKFVAIGLLSSLLVGCGAKKQDSSEVNKYLEQIEQMQIELDNEKEKSNAFQIKADGKVDALLESIEMLESIVGEQEDLIDYLKEIVKELNGIDENLKILFQGIGLGSSNYEVEEAFGKDYTVESIHDEFYDKVLTTWKYPNADVVLVDNQVVEIVLYNDFYDTNFGVNVGDFAHQAITVCDNFIYQYVSPHTEDGTPNLGWYHDDEGGILIIYFNDKDDKLNMDVNVETARIGKIVLKSSWMFD